MRDITIIMPTLNKLPEGWVRFHRNKLIEAIEDTPIITISKTPLDWGINIIQESEGLDNLYRQIFKAANMVNTPYFAIAEDDSLYTKEHFKFRPSLDTIAYDINRWIIFCWGRPFYFLKQSRCNAGMIAPTELYINTWKKIMDQYPVLPNMALLELGRNRYARGVKTISYNCNLPYVCLKHKFSVELAQQRQNKKPGDIQKNEIEFWGDANNIRREFV